MAIPSPASDRMEMDFTTIAGISMFHLRQRDKSMTVLSYRFSLIIAVLLQIILLS
jgi:hypothetical protein